MPPVAQCCNASGQEHKVYPTSAVTTPEVVPDLSGGWLRTATVGQVIPAALVKRGMTRVPVVRAHRGGPCARHLDGIPEYPDGEARSWRRGVDLDEPGEAPTHG